MPALPFELDLLNASLLGLLIALVSALVTWWVINRRVNALQKDNTQLRVELATEKQQTAALTESRDALSDHFNALSGAALQRNSEAFLRLARESLQHHHVRAQAELDKREQSIDAMVTPIREALNRTQQQIQLMEKERKQAYGGLSQHLASLVQTQNQLQTETRNLVQALKRPDVRGQWGELTLKRLVEMAGMVEHCDFTEQPTVASDQGVLRPDMVIRLPENRTIVVDAKTPLDGYLNGMEAADDAARRQAMVGHARNVRQRIRNLADKNYWAQFDQSPEFVVLFIPGEQFLAAALDVDATLQEDALAARIILATPNNFVALMKTIAFGWRQQSVTENAERIRHLGEDLHGRIATFLEHLLRTGRQLNSAVESYNRSIGSLERQVLPGARRFGELGIQSKKELQRPETLATAAREPNSETPGDPDEPPKTH